MATILQAIIFAGLGGLLSYLGFLAGSSWEYWGVMGLALSASVVSFWQGAK